VRGFLVDTNVISEFTKPQPDLRVIDWLDIADTGYLFASVITYGEIRLGIEDLPSGRRRTELEIWLRIGVPGWFGSNLLPVTGVVADRWGRLTIQAKRRGVTIGAPDGLIAATALEHDLTIVTRNVKDFAGTCVAIFNPWSV
jgi:predicted nucleic acid-binding protein